MSTLDPVGPLGTLAPEITKKAPNLNLSRLARQESTPAFFLFWEKSCLASLELRVPREPTGANIDTEIVGLRPLDIDMVNCKGY